MTQDTNYKTSFELQVPHGICPHCDSDCEYWGRCLKCRRWTVQRWWLVPFLIMFFPLMGFGMPVVSLWLPLNQVEPIWDRLNFSVEIWEGWSMPISWLSLLVLTCLSAWIAELKNQPIRFWVINTLCFGLMPMVMLILLPAWRDWQKALMLEAHRNIYSDFFSLIRNFSHLTNNVTRLITHVEVLQDQLDEGVMTPHNQNRLAEIREEQIKSQATLNYVQQEQDNLWQTVKNLQTSEGNLRQDVGKLQGIINIVPRLIITVIIGIALAVLQKWLGTL